MKKFSDLNFREFKNNFTFVNRFYFSGKRESINDFLDNIMGLKKINHLKTFEKNNDEEKKLYEKYFNRFTQEEKEEENFLNKIKNLEKLKTIKKRKRSEFLDFYTNRNKLNNISDYQNKMINLDLNIDNISLRFVYNKYDLINHNKNEGVNLQIYLNENKEDVIFIFNFDYFDKLVNFYFFG